MRAHHRVRTSNFLKRVPFHPPQTVSISRGGKRFGRGHRRARRPAFVAPRRRPGPGAGARSPAPPDEEMPPHPTPAAPTPRCTATESTCITSPANHRRRSRTGTSPVASAPPARAPSPACSAGAAQGVGQRGSPELPAGSGCRHIEIEDHALTREPDGRGSGDLAKPGTRHTRGHLLRHRQQQPSAAEPRHTAVASPSASPSGSTPGRSSLPYPAYCCATRIPARS